MKQSLSFDVAVIGGGIVGCATAYTLSRQFPGLSIAVLEKEKLLASHQTGRNSGVIHSGIYYKPGSLKARNCTAGRDALIAFCQEHAVPFELCGKVVVAVDERELPALASIQERATANGVPCERLDAASLRSLEPAAKGVAALHVPGTGIVNYREVTEELARLFTSQERRILLSTRVTAIKEEARSVRLSTTGGKLEAGVLVNCAGLQSDRIAVRCGVRSAIKIVPFRGEYFELSEHASRLCRNLIYPVPDASFPFLGVHFTRMIGGGVECGPNAVLAFGRECYGKSEINLLDLAESLAWPGFRRLAFR